MKINTGSELAVKSAKRISGITSTSTICQFMPHGDIPAIKCAGCGIPLATDETYACVRCCAGWMQDDNIKMHGGGDEESPAKM